MSILRFSGVTREIGTFVILDAIEAAVALGDRIGLVGPNGAGKTTMLRLAAGRDEPDRGTVQRKRGLSIGLLAQESHFDAAFMAAPDLRTAVRTGAAHLERDGRRARGVRARRTGRRGGLRRPAAPVRGARRLHPGPARRRRPERARLQPGRVGPSRPTALSGGEQTRAALARLVIARSGPAAARRADQPPRPRRARVARGPPPPADGLAPRRVARPRLPRRDRHPDLGAARPAADGVPRRLQRLPPPARGARRAGRARTPTPRPSRSPASASSSSATAATASSRRCTSTRPGSSGCRRSVARRPETVRKLTLPQAALAGGGPARSGEIVVRVEDLAVGYLPGRGAVRAGRRTRPRRPQVVARVPFLAAQRGDRIGIVGPNGAGKTTLLRTIAGRAAAARRVADVRAQRCSSATSPSCAARRSRARPSSTRCSTRSR